MEPFRQFRLPGAATFVYLWEEGSLSDVCTYFWYVLSGYYQIETASVDACCLITVCWLYSKRPTDLSPSYYCHVALKWALQHGRILLYAVPLMIIITYINNNVLHLK